MKFNWIAKLIPSAILTVGLASFTMGQAPGPTGGKLTPGKQAARARHPIFDALAKLNLTEDQETKIKALVKTRDDDLKVFRKTHQGDQQANRTHTGEVLKTFLEGIKGVLTQRQWEQFQVGLKSMRGAGKGNGGSASPPTKA